MSEQDEIDVVSVTAEFACFDEVFVSEAVTQDVSTPVKFEDGEPSGDDGFGDGVMSFLYDLLDVDFEVARRGQMKVDDDFCERVTIVSGDVEDGGSLMVDDDDVEWVAEDEEIDEFLVHVDELTVDVSPESFGEGLVADPEGIVSVSLRVGGEDPLVGFVMEPDAEESTIEGFLDIIRVSIDVGDDLLLSGQRELIELDGHREGESIDFVCAGIEDEPPELRDDGVGDGPDDNGVELDDESVRELGGTDLSAEGFEESGEVIERLFDDLSDGLEDVLVIDGVAVSRHVAGDEIPCVS